MDAGSLQALIDKLRDLTASDFANAGFTTPEIEITVVSNDGKRTGKRSSLQDLRMATWRDGKVNLRFTSWMRNP